MFCRPNHCNLPGKLLKVPCANLISSLSLKEQKKALPLLTLSPKQVVLPAYRPTVTKRGGLRTSKSCILKTEIAKEVIPRFHGFLHSSIASSRYQVYMYCTTRSPCQSGRTGKFGLSRRVIPVDWILFLGFRLFICSNRLFLLGSKRYIHWSQVPSTFSSI